VLIASMLRPTRQRVTSSSAMAVVGVVVMGMLSPWIRV
jgi:hypothetical protein